MHGGIAILGVGLIGGSLLHRLKGHIVVGYDTDPATREAARQAGFSVADSISQAVATADLVVAAVPLPALPALLAELGTAARPGAVITDVASVKGPVGEWVRGPVRYVGGHPMAGTERSGFAAADPYLFNKAAWVLCLEADTDPTGWLELAAVLTTIGARVVPTTAAEHDDVVARISHLPHLLAATLAGAAADPLAQTLAAGSFRDGTRVAGTRPELSTAMCQANAAALDTALAQAITALQETRTALADNTLETLFRRAYDIRKNWPSTKTKTRKLDPNAADLRDQLLALGRQGGWLTEIEPGALTGEVPL